MIIIQDSREQTPYRFTIPSEVGTLNVGDYSIAGLEDVVAVERKTLSDLIACLTKDRERFKARLQRGEALESFHVVVEADLKTIASGNYRSRMKAQAAVQSLVALSLRYKVPIWFAGTREGGQVITQSILEKFFWQIRKRYKIANGGTLEYQEI